MHFRTLKLGHPGHGAESTPYDHMCIRTAVMRRVEQIRRYYRPPFTVWTCYYRAYYRVINIDRAFDSAHAALHPWVRSFIKAQTNFTQIFGKIN